MNPRSRRNRQGKRPAETPQEAEIQETHDQDAWEPGGSYAATPSPWTLYLPGLLLLAGAGALAGAGGALPQLARLTDRWNLSPGIFLAAGHKLVELFVRVDAFSVEPFSNAEELQNIGHDSPRHRRSLQCCCDDGCDYCC